MLAAHGLEVFDVEELATHGGSLRVYAQRAGAGRPACAAVSELAEARAGLELDRLEDNRIRGARGGDRWRLLEFLIDCRRDGKRVAGYGAPGQGEHPAQLLRHRTDLLEFTVDRNPYKQGKFLPGTRIPIHHPEALEQARPDFIVILPWNLTDEIMVQLAHTREWGGRFVVPIPEVKVL